jgi:hypothetical protein
VTRYNEIEKELSLTETGQPIKVEVVLDDYDYKSARELVRTVNTFFRNPKAIVSQIKSKDISFFSGIKGELHQARFWKSAWKGSPRA